MKKPVYSPYFFKKNMVFSIAVVVLCSLLLVGIFSYFVYNSNLQAVERSTDNANQSCYYHVENTLDNATRICMFFASYKTVSPVFQSQQTTFDLQQATLREEMRTFIACNDFLANITVETEDYTISHGYGGGNSFSQPVKYKGFDISYLTENNWANTLRISFTSDSSDFYNVSVDIYTNYLSDLYFDENTYCCTPDGTLLMAGNPGILGQNLYTLLDITPQTLAGSSSRFSAANRPLDQTGFSLVTLKDTRSLMPQILLNTLSYFATCILVFALVIPIIYLQLKRIYRPVNKVIDIFKYYLPQNETYIEDDIKFISNCVSDPDMGQVTQAAVLQIRKSQLYTLQSQISPHFLGNSLDIISWKAVDALGLDNPISESLNILSLFLSDTYEYASMFLPLRDEIRRAQEYVKLAQYCFLKHLKVDWQIDPNVLQYSIISLTLQPLIENSIVHGFMYPEHKARAAISISVLPEGQDIAITLRDNGSGMSGQTLSQLRAALASEEPSKHHIGLKNTHWKLRLLYGEKYGITHIESNDQGTSIRLLIPQYLYPSSSTPPQKNYD